MFRQPCEFELKIYADREIFDFFLLNFIAPVGLSFSCSTRQFETLTESISKVQLRRFDSVFSF